MKDYKGKSGKSNASVILKWSVMRLVPITASVLLLASSLGAVQAHEAAVEARAPSPLVIRTAAEITPEPPKRLPKAILENGRYNWSPSYTMQSMVYLLKATKQERWAQELVKWGNAMLAERDAPHPFDGRPVAWTDRSKNVLEPYVWAGFTGHMFAPLIEFSRFVMEHPELQSQVFEGRSLREHAVSFMHEFRRALEVHLVELKDDGRHAFFRFSRPVPVTNKAITGQPLPVNMNAALFTAMLHLSRAERAMSSTKAEPPLEQYIIRYVAYLHDAVLSRYKCELQICVTWQYSTYIHRSEDIGHANSVIKFIYDAHADGFEIPRGELEGIANTIVQLVREDSTFRGNLLDGSEIAGSRTSIYYIILLAKYSSTLRARIEPIVVRSGNFAYLGPWLQISK